MSEGSTQEPLIIIKKKKAHGGHHGGAWKVAYADFVTAMMALFIVLWLMNSSKEVQEAVGGYFQDPTGYASQSGGGVGGSGDGIVVGRDEMSQLKDTISSAMHDLTEFQELKDHVRMSVGSDGLRVELLESEMGMFFESGSAKPSANGEELLIMLARQLGGMEHDILLEGHTDSKPFSNPDYSNWELSTDRANSARRFMERNGLRPGQVAQVRGYADQKLLNPADPLDPANRRISVIVQYPSPTAGEERTQHTEHGTQPQQGPRQ